MRRFSKKAFLEPPAELTPAYFWGINSVMEIGQLKRQLHEMFDNGCRSVCLHPFPKEWRPKPRPSRMSPDYLSDEYMEIIKALVDECKRIGMQYYLYDEGGFPSGGACGKIWAENPEKYSRTTYYPENDTVVRYDMQYQPEVSSPYPDILVPGVTERFIELTHERHKDYIGKHLGNTVKYVFTDEPSMPNWTAAIPKHFRKKTGLSLEDNIEKIFSPKAEEPSETTEIRIAYYEILTQLFLKHYLLPIRRWCRKNHVLSGGHFNLEDTPDGHLFGGYGNIMQALRHLDLPGVDAIWRQVFPGKQNNPFPKYASSAANQNGTALAMAEIFAVYSNSLTPKEMRFVADYMLVRGINLFVLSLFMQDHYEHWMSGCRPHRGPCDPMWKYMKIFHDYLSRNSSLLSMGKSANDTAFYYDIRSIYAGAESKENAIADHLEISEKLLQMQCGFDYIDDIMLASAAVQDGSIKIGKAFYKVLVIPESRWISREAREKIKEFSASGGTVLSPDQLSGAPRLVKSSSSQLRVLKRVAQGKAIYFFTNESSEKQRIRITLPEQENLVFADPLDGKFYAVKSSAGTFEWSFDGYGSAAFVTGVTPDAVYPKESFRNRTSIENGWKLQVLKHHFPGRNDYEIKEAESSAISCQLGDWTPYVGKDFSGEGLYTVDFENPGDVKNAVLDLGEVCYGCTVKLNGKEVGKSFFSPHRFAVVLHPGKNRLAIFVSNLFSNALASEKTQRDWEKYREIMPYEEMQLEFETEGLAGGLMGPVNLYY